MMKDNQIQSTALATLPEKITLPEFWKTISSNLDEGIENFNEIYKTELAAALAAAIAESFSEDSSAQISITRRGERILLSHRASTTRLFRLWWREKGKIFFGLIILLVMGGLFYLLWANFVEMKQRVTVKKTGGLPAFHKIMPEDLTTTGPTSGQAALRINNLVGRYVLVAIPENSAVTEKELARREFSDEINNRKIIPISVNPKLLDDSVTSNRKISLTLVKNEGPFDESAIVADVILLGITKRESGGVIVVALTPEQVSEINPLLGKSEIFIGY